MNLVKMLNKLLKYYINKVKRYFEKDTKARFLVFLGMSAIIIFVAYIIFLLTWEGLYSTQDVPDEFVAKAGPLFIYQIFLLVIGFLIFVSTIIFGLFNFFRGEDDTWIIASPEYKKIFWINFFKAFMNSTWPILVMAIPLLLAIQSVFEFHYLMFFWGLFVMMLFSFFCSASAIILIFLLSLVVKFFRYKSFVLLAILSGLFSLFIGVFIWFRVVAIDLEQMFQVEEMVAPSLATIMQNFSVFPSYYPAMSMFFIQQGDLLLSLQYGGFMLAVCIFAGILFLLIKEMFLPIWQMFQEGSFEAKTEYFQKKRRPYFTYFPTSPERVVFIKEWISGVRSTKNISWFLFVLILLFIQIGVINLLSNNTSFGEEDVFGALIPSLQLGMLLYFICAFILRFVFPSFSQEGSTSWILGAAPLNFKNVFRAKFKFFSLMVVLIGVFAILLYIIPLSVSLNIALSLIAFLIFSCIILTMMGLSLGAIFINFETNDPQLLGTSAPGIGFTLLSLAYTGFSAYAFYLALSGITLSLAMTFFVVSVIIYSLCKFFALRSLEKVEYY